MQATTTAAHTTIAALFRSTAFTLVTTAVTVSVRRSAIIGSEKALAAKTILANMAPTALPMPRKGTRSRQEWLVSTGKKMCTIEAARAQTRKTTSTTTA